MDNPIPFNYLYFYRNEDGNNVPILTGSSRTLENVIWINDKEKQALKLDFNISSDLFVWIEGTEFLIQ